MPVEFRCPHCKKLLRVPDNARGKRGRCPHCKEINDIPAASDPAPRPATMPSPAPLDPFAGAPSAPYSPGPLDLLSDLPETPGLTPISNAYSDPLGGAAPTSGHGRSGFAGGGFGGGNYGGGYAPSAAARNPYSAPSYSPAAYSGTGYSSDQFDESQPLSDSDRPGIPWENRRRDGTLFETAKQVLLQPAYAFGSMRRSGGLGRPLGFAIYCSLIGGTINLVISLVFNLIPTLIQVALGQMPPQLLGFVFVVMAINLVVGLIAVAIFGTLAAIIGAFIHSAVLHLVLMMLNGARGTFEATFRLSCYTQGTLALLNVVPCIGPLAAFIMYYVISIIGVRWTHEISLGKSVAAVFITSAVFFGLVVIPLILLVVLFAALVIGFTSQAMH